MMAATAFLAASSRSSAAKMGRPLSVRILLASWTLVPEKGQKKKREEKQCYNRRQPTLQKWLNKGEPDLPSARMLKTTLCERRRVPLEESIHTDRWSHGSMVAHATADPNVVECEQRAKGQFVCARVCVSAPPAVVRSGVAGAG